MAPWGRWNRLDWSVCWSRSDCRTRDAVLTEMFYLGKSDLVIAKVLDLNRSTIRLRRVALGLAKKPWATPGAPWTEEQDANLRKFHAERKNDPTIAYIMSVDVKTIRRHRHLLGLPSMGSGSRRGTKQSKEARAKIGAAVRRSLEVPARKAQNDAHLNKARKVWLGNLFKLPPAGSKARLLYKKLVRCLGPEKAREELRRVETKVQSQASATDDGAQGPRSSDGLARTTATQQAGFYGGAVAEGADQVLVQANPRRN